MSPKNPLKMIPWALGVCLLVGSMTGAHRLLQTPDGNTNGGGGKATTPSLPGGVVVLGVVDTDPLPVPIGPPALAGMSATVEKVLVHDGQEVKPGDALVQFNDTMFRTKLDQAKAELSAAEKDVQKAEVQKKVHAIDVERQKKAIAQAEADLAEARNIYNAARNKFNTVTDENDKAFKRETSQADREKQMGEDPDLRKAAYAATVALPAKVEDEKKQLAKLELKPVDLDAGQAADKVQRLKATVAEAEAAVNACLVKVKETGGVVEQVMAAPGATYGPSTRGPLMWLIPNGKRLVRAEVEAEFASRIADKVGKQVVISDHSNLGLSYPGVVKQIGTAFVPKRSAGEALLSVNSTRVLECVIEVSDPAPAGKPPLRVWQPVRVSFP